jgi:hypothetical protein
VARGEKIAAFALTEPDSGSDVASIATRAEERDGCWVLNGEKTFISNGGIADFYVVFARTGEAPGSKGLSAFLVERGTAGLDDSQRIEVIAPHPLATLSFREMRLPASALIGERGRGFQQAMATLDVFRTTVGAAALGFARRALDEATGRALSRRLGAGTLADNPVTQSKLAEMVLDVETSALLVYRAAWLRDVMGRRNSREAALAKLHATDSAQSVIDKAVQMFGGLGVTKGVAVERLYREIRALRIYEGASEVQKLVIARHHLAEHSGNEGAPAARLAPAQGLFERSFGARADDLHRRRDRLGRTGKDRRPRPPRPASPGASEHPRYPRRGRRRAGAYRPDDLVRRRPRRLSPKPRRRSARSGSEVMGRVYPAMAVVEVSSLVEPAARIEIEATAVVPD